jgi:hypothetical protein
MALLDVKHWHTIIYLFLIVGVLKRIYILKVTW